MIEPAIHASDPAHSAWVAANAGAGKTFTLANRVARLLLAGTGPEKILCLTFTKAAAAEMQHRLFEQLGEWAMLGDHALEKKIAAIGAETIDLPKARRLFAQALETPGGLKILTLHAFCQTILARFPVEAGVAPRFDVLDDAAARALIGEARQKTLERAGRREAPLAEATAFLVTEIGEARLISILDAALGNDRRKLDRFFDGLHDRNFKEEIWRAHRVDPDCDTAGDFCALLRGEAQRLRAARDWLSQGRAGDQDGAAALGEFLAGDFKADGFLALNRWLITDKGMPRIRLVSKKLEAARPDLLAYVIDLQTRFCAAEDRRRAARAARLTERALTLIQAVRKEYADAKKRRSVLDYDDLIVKTRALLESGDAASWVLFKLDNGIDHILIDEAQDTSPEQWRIVRKLAEEFFAGEGRTGRFRTIFAVGDEKQSIFSFQGADPLQFDANRRHFERLAAAAGQPFVDQSLEMSRRSAPAILSFVDRVFADPGARTGLSSRGDPIRHTAHRASERGGVEFWVSLAPSPTVKRDFYLPVDAPQADSPVVLLARRVAKQIKDWLETPQALPGHDKPVSPGDIMILLPRREPFGGEVIRQLKLRQIPVSGADRIVLTEQIAVMDLMALGRFALQREDDLDLAALLKSPLVGLGEDDLFALCHRRGASLWQALAGRRDRPPFDAAHRFLSEMLASVDFAPPFEFFSHALIALDKKRALIASLGPESQDAIEEFLSLALRYEETRTPSLEGFLDWVARGNTEVKRDMERARDQVRVMTVHGAKGLEADIVILPDTTTLPDSPARKGHLLYHGDGVLFPLAEADAPDCVKAVKRFEEQETLAEHRRLLYVALTRARDRLYVCGFENRQGVRQGSWYRLAEAAAGAMGRPLIRHGRKALAIGDVENEKRSSASAGTAKEEMPRWLTVHDPPRQRLLSPLIRPSDAVGLPEPPPLSPLSGGKDRFKRGNLIHTLLARLPDVAPQTRMQIAARYAIGRGFPEDEAREIAKATIGIIENPQFAAAFTRSSRAEVAFLAALPELGPDARVGGRVDRLAVTPGEVLIVDFKTHRPPPSRQEDVSPVYLTQMALYRAAASRIFPGRTVVCGLIWTEGPFLMRLTEAILDREWARVRQRLDPDGKRS
ncbi:MAG: double-strand break repair helicase AddA [Rhizomicrobium sp.]